MEKFHLFINLFHRYVKFLSRLDPRTSFSFNRPFPRSQTKTSNDRRHENQLLCWMSDLGLDSRKILHFSPYFQELYFSISTEIESRLVSKEKLRLRETGDLLFTPFRLRKIDRSPRGELQGRHFYSVDDVPPRARTNTAECHVKNYPSSCLMIELEHFGAVSPWSVGELETGNVDLQPRSKVMTPAKMLERLTKK